MMQPHYSIGLVVLSILVAVISAYVALDLTQRSVRAKRPAARRRWLLLGSGVIGMGIWSMHFIGMLALDLHMRMSYQLSLVALSMLVAVLGAGIALHVVTRTDAGRGAVFTGAAFMGLAVAAMHYIGIASMETEVHVRWNLKLVALSLLIAYGASLVALSLVSRVRSNRHLWSPARRAGAAVAIGLGVAGLHYTGMAAASFHSVTASHAAGGIDTGWIAALLGIAASLMLVVLLVGATLDQQRGALVPDLNAIAVMMRDIGREGNARERICIAACELTGATYSALLAPGQLRIVDASHGTERDSVFTHHEPVLLDGVTTGVLVVGWTYRLRRLPDRVATIAALLATEAAFAIERDDMVAQLARLAHTDELTGLPNRRTVDAALLRTLSRSAGGRGTFCVVMLDIDHFKAYNDEHGHQGGDRLLKAAASAWRGVLRQGDLVARYGGEEFLVVLPRCTLAAAAQTADRLRGALPDGVTCSAGVAAWDAAETTESLLGRADIALYAAKSAGRDRTVSAAGPEAGAASRVGE